LKHILQPDAEVDERFITKGKSFCLTASYSNTSKEPKEKEVSHEVKKKQRTLVKTELYSGRDIGRRLNTEGQREDTNTDLPITRRIEIRNDEKSGTVQKDTMVVSPTNIRKLTPIECERLQSLPDGYTDGVAMTQRYRCLGNAFNVDVVAHILFHMSQHVFG
jgi:site-specific DNA-cytosine methylase